MTEVSTRSTTERGPRPVLPVADRLAARRPGPDGPVQLGVRASPRRHLRLPDRGHRRRARQPGVLRHPARGDALARLRLGRGPRGRRPPRAVPPERARATSTRDVLARLREAGRHLRLLLHQRGGRGPPQGLRLQGAWATTASAATSPPSRWPPSRPRAATRSSRFRMPDGEITFDDLVRGEITFHTEHVPDFARRPGQRPAALHAGQPGRRRADGDHPRAARRGPAVQHPAPARAVRRARARSASRTRTPRFGHLPYVMGQGNKKLSKRDPEANLLGYRDPGLPARGTAQLPRPARLGDRRRPRRLHHRGDGRRPSTSATSTPTRRAST